MRLLSLWQMLWLVIVWTIAIVYSEVRTILACANSSVSKYTLATNCNRYTWASPMLKQLNWLQVKYCCIFKIATLLYKFLHSGHLGYFGSPLSICFRYNTIYNHPDKSFLEVPGGTVLLLMLSQFGVIYLMMFVLPVSLACLRKQLNCYLFKKAFPP